MNSPPDTSTYIQLQTHTHTQASIKTHTHKPSVMGECSMKKERERKKIHRFLVPIFIYGFGSRFKPINLFICVKLGWPSNCVFLPFCWAEGKLFFFWPGLCYLAPAGNDDQHCCCPEHWCQAMFVTATATQHRYSTTPTEIL